MDFKGKTVVITGGNSGIGLSAGKRFASMGAYLMFTGRQQEKIQCAEYEILALGGACEGFQVEMTDAESLKRFFAIVKQKRKTIDVLFANAGINGQWSPIEELPVEEWDKTYAVNIRGAFLTLKYGIPLMKEHGGAIILNSSINGTRSFTNRGASAYASSKAAEAALGKMAALELAPYHIRVNTICPGATYTGINDNTFHIGNEKLTQWVEHPHGFIPLQGNQWGSAEQVADTVMFLASDKASYITGTEIYVDGGTSLIL